MLKLPVKSPIVNGDIDLSEYAKKSDVDAIDASLDNKAEKKDVEKISSQLDTKTQELENSKASKQEIDIERKRIDSFTRLQEGSTTGDAELIDARIGCMGEVYTNLGDGIRNQFSFLADNGMVVKKKLNVSSASVGYITYEGYLSTDTAYHISDIELNKNETILLYGRGYLNKVSTIAEQRKGSYIPLIVSSDSEIKWYEYTADKKINVTLSFLNKEEVCALIIEKTSTIKKITEDKIDKNMFNFKDNVSNITDDCYIQFSNGKKMLGTKSNHVMSDEIFLKEGQTVYVECKAVENVVSVISEVKDGKYIPLVGAISVNENNGYRYEAPNDMRVVISAQGDWNRTYGIYNINASNVTENIKKKTIDILKPFNFKNEIINVTDDCYIQFSDGKKMLGTKSNHVMSDEIFLNKNDCINVNCRAVENVVSVISEVKGGKYIPLVNAISMDSDNYHSFVAPKDMNVVISAKKGWNKEYNIYNVKSYNDGLTESLYYPSFSLFEKFAVIGDSYASGEVCLTGYNDYYNVSWGQILARMSGSKCINMSAGGLSTRTWLSSNKGLTLLNSSDPQQLYILALGINDYYHLGESYLGTIADIETKADTFYGNYAKIIEAIKVKAPNAKIIISTATGYKDIIKKFNEAIINIANYYAIPYIIQNKSEFFNSDFYNNNMMSGHPIAITYSAMAKAIKELIEKCMYENIDYFKDYIG